MYAIGIEEVLRLLDNGPVVRVVKCVIRLDNQKTFDNRKVIETGNLTSAQVKEN